MKKNILLLILFLSTTTLFAQDTKINISPKTFYNTILLTSKMESETNIDVVFYNINNEEVKKYSYENIATKSLKVDLKNLTAGKDYTVKVFNNGTLLHSEKLHKSIKANK